jgi:hypothetical protein
MSLEEDLGRATFGWTIDQLARTFEESGAGEGALAREAAILSRHGYVPAARSAVNDGDRHVNPGRTLAKAAATGGIGLVLFGRSRSRGKVHTLVTFERRASEHTAANEWSHADHIQDRSSGASVGSGLAAAQIADAFDERFPVEGVTVEIVGPPPWRARVTGVLHNGQEESVEAAEVAIVGSGSLWRDPQVTTIVIAEVVSGSSHPFRVELPPPMPAMMNGEAWIASAHVTRVRTGGRWLSSPEEKSCEDCGELIQRAARVCRYCGYRFPTQRTDAPPAARGGDRPDA